MLFYYSYGWLERKHRKFIYRYRIHYEHGVSYNSNIHEQFISGSFCRKNQHNHHGMPAFGGTIGVAAGSIALHTTVKYTVSILIVGTIHFIGSIAGIFMNSPKVFCLIEVEEEIKKSKV
jgi:hypothetical protein